MKKLIHNDFDLAMLALPDNSIDLISCDDDKALAHKARKQYDRVYSASDAIETRWVDCESLASYACIDERTDLVWVEGSLNNSRRNLPII